MAEVHGNAKISPIKRAKIISAILQNVPYEMAAHMARISERTLYYWLTRGIEDDKNSIESEYSAFLQDVKQAEANKIAAHLEAIEQQSERWQSRAWILERRWRKHFGADAGIIQELLDKQAQLEKHLTKFLENDNAKTS